MPRSTVLFAALLANASLALAQSNDLRRHEMGHALGDEDYVQARIGVMDARDARRVIALRLEAMRARIVAIDAGLEDFSKSERKDIVVRGIEAASAATESHPQEVLDLVAAATGDASQGSASRGVSERLRHRDRAIAAESTDDLLELVEALENETKKSRGNRNKDKETVARLEVRVNRIEMAFAGIEAGLQTAMKRPGRLK